jgi:hypothetical protein
MSAVFQEVFYNRISPAFTPITKINLKIIKDLDLYKHDQENDNNLKELRIEPEEVEQYELLDL